MYINQKGNLAIILGIIVLLIVTAGGAYYLGIRQNKQSLAEDPYLPIPSSNSSQPTKSPTPNKTAVVDGKYITRYFNVNEPFVESEKYPLELTEMSENLLTPMNCTGLYLKQVETYETTDQKTKQQKVLTDPTLLTLIENIHSKYQGKSVTEINACSTEQGTTVILYALDPCGGGCSGRPYIGISMGTPEVTEIAAVEEGFAYFACRNPLQLTKNNIFYFKCGAGDGPAGTASIYKISLASNKIDRVKFCSIKFDESLTNSTVKCD